MKFKATIEKDFNELDFDSVEDAERHMKNMYGYDAKITLTRLETKYLIGSIFDTNYCKYMLIGTDFQESKLGKRKAGFIVLDGSKTDGAFCKTSEAEYNSGMTLAEVIKCLGIQATVCRAITN